MTIDVRIYKDSCADYYPKTPNQTEYKKQIDCLTSSSLLKFVYVDEKKGIRLVGLLEKIWQVIKGFFGFTDNTKAVLIKSETLKLLHYGKLNNFLESEEVLNSIKNFKTALESNQTKAAKSVSSLVKDISDGCSPTLSDFQEKLVTFHQKHEEDLKPGFWQRLLVSPQIIKTTQMSFGASHLQLAEQSEKDSVPYASDKKETIEQKNLARDEALKQYHFALSFEDKNLEQKVHLQFKKFLENGWPQGKNTSNWNLIPQEQKDQILQILIKLSLSDNCDMAESKISEEYAAFGIRYFFNDLTLLTTKYIAQVKQKKYQEAFKNSGKLEKRAEELELSFKCLNSEEKSSKKNLIVELKKIYETLGEIFSQYNYGWIVDTREYSKASTYFHKAWQKDPSDVNLEIKLFRSLMSAGEKESWWGYFKSWIGISNQEGNEFVKHACEYISSIKSEDYQRLIHQFEKQKQYDKAIYFYELGIKKLSDKELLKISANSYYRVGLAKKQEENGADSYEDFKKAAEIEPNNPTYINQLFDHAKQMGLDYLNNNDLLAARHYFNEALQRYSIEGEKKEIQEYLGQICTHLAEENINKCLVPFKDYSSFSDDWKKHKKMYKDSLMKALKWYDEAIQNDPKKGIFHFDKAELINFFEMKGEDCFKEYEQAVDCNPNNYFYLLRLSEVYNERNDEKNALKYKELALEIRKGCAFDYLHWYDDRFLRDKVYDIDPHTF